MANIIIDGYNLIGTAHQKLENERNKLIDDLSSYSKAKGHDITLVFDGWKNGLGPETRMTVSGIRVIYSRLSEKADSVIMRILSEGQKAWIVISTDREIADFAHSKDHVPITSEEFEYVLYSTLHPSEDMEEDTPEEEDETDYPSPRLKGNPRKLSRKQKKKLQVLKKL